jgi:hypothetical protein
MSRIVKNEPVIDQTNETPAPKKKKVNGFSFKKKLWLAIMVFAVFLSLSVTAAIAQTGIFQIPGFSQVFYRLPQPVRLVELPEPFKVTTEGFSVKASSEEGLMVFNFGEKEMTYVLRQLIMRSKDPIFGDNIQVVFLDKEIEVYGLLLKPIKANLTVRFRPEVKNEVFNYAITKLKIGNLSIPPFLAESYLRRTLGVKNKSFEDQMFALVRVKNIEVKEGSLSLIAWVDTKRLMDILLYKNSK